VECVDEAIDALHVTVGVREGSGEDIDTARV
jgi:hypothetical protein